MKLKKIASLALAGIMAVSMLAGCKDSGNSNSGSSSENTNTTSGYSAMLGQKVAETLSKNDLDEIFTFADNADDQKALKQVVLDNITQNDVTNYLTTVVSIKNASDLDTPAQAVVTSFMNKIEATSGIGGWFTTDSLNKSKVASVWVANGSVDMSTVMDNISNAVKDSFADADDKGDMSGVNLSYEYEVSVSVENVPATANTNYTGSVNFIAVTVTRTATHD